MSKHSWYLTGGSSQERLMTRKDGLGFASLNNLNLRPFSCEGSLLWTERRHDHRYEKKKLSMKLRLLLPG